MSMAVSSLDGTRYLLKDDPYSSHSVIFKRLGPGLGRRLLDVGAADGSVAGRLSRQGFVVTCLERDPELAERARESCDRVVTCDLDQAIPPLENRYDVIVYADILEHLRDPRRVFEQLNRFLADDGIIIVSVPNVAHLAIRLMLLAGRFDYMDRGILDQTHLRFFTHRSLLKFFEETSVRVEAIIPTPLPLGVIFPRSVDRRWFRLVNAINAMTAHAWKRGLAYQFVAVARLRGAR